MFSSWDEIASYAAQFSETEFQIGKVLLQDGAGRTPAGAGNDPSPSGEILGVNQAAVSKMERRADSYVTTLQDFVKAMGGELKIIAQLPDGTVEIRRLGEGEE